MEVCRLVEARHGSVSKAALANRDFVCIRIPDVISFFRIADFQRLRIDISGYKIQINHGAGRKTILICFVRLTGIDRCQTGYIVFLIPVICIAVFICNRREQQQLQRSLCRFICRHCGIQFDRHTDRQQLAAGDRTIRKVSILNDGTAA